MHVTSPICLCKFFKKTRPDSIQILQFSILIISEVKLWATICLPPRPIRAKKVIFLKISNNSCNQVSNRKQKF